MAVRSDRDKPCPYICRVLVWAALALVVALPARAKAAEEPGTLKLSCEGGTVTLETQAAPAAAVLRALEKECGLLLEGKEYIPERPVTVTYEKVTLEEVIEALIRLADLPNTILAMASSGVLKLAVLATGREAPTKAATPWATPWAPPPAVEATVRDGPEADGAFAVDEEAAREVARGATLRQFYLAGTARERQLALAELKSLDPDEAWILQQSDPEELAAERADAAAEEARRRFFLAGTDRERQRALAELKRLDPDEAWDMQELSAEELAAEQVDAAVEEARRQFLLAKWSGERNLAMEAMMRLDPDEAEDLFN